jgi:hypothetical protein
MWSHTRRLISLSFFPILPASLLFAEHTEISRDTSISRQERIADLTTKLSLEEKISLKQDNAPAIPLLRIPESAWSNEALHGVAADSYANVSQKAIGLAATWGSRTNPLSAIRGTSDRKFRCAAADCLGAEKVGAANARSNSRRNCGE